MFSKPENPRKKAQFIEKKFGKIFIAFEILEIVTNHEVFEFRDKKIMINMRDSLRLIVTKIMLNV